MLGKIPRTTVYRNIQQYPEATKVPGVLIIRIDSAIYFSNSNYIKDRYITCHNLQDFVPIHLSLACKINQY